MVTTTSVRWYSSSTPSMGRTHAVASTTTRSATWRGSSTCSKKFLPLQENIATAVEFLQSERASFITGQTLSVSGGLTMA